MPDIGWMELLVVGIVALIVVGPKDLPVMFRKLGQFTGRIKGMARDFQRAMDDAARESGVDDLKRDIGEMSKYTNPRKMGMDALSDVMNDIDPTKYDEGSATRDLAEKKAAAQKLQRETVAKARADKAAPEQTAPKQTAPKTSAPKKAAPRKTAAKKAAPGKAAATADTAATPPARTVTDAS